jgi:hypothetical protein
MTPMEWIALAEQGFELFMRIRNAAKEAGVTDEELDAITLDYDQRIARRQAEAADVRGGDGS